MKPLTLTKWQAYAAARGLSAAEIADLQLPQEGAARISNEAF